MKKQEENASLRLHPMVILLYFILVITLIMSLENPLGRLICLLGGFFTLNALEEGQNLKQNIRLIGLMLVFASLFNFIFIKSGATLLLDYRFMLFQHLFRVKFTLEALLFGVSYGVMMSAMLLWFQVCSHVLTPEKIRYLLGGKFPIISLLLTMILQMIPLIKTQLIATQTAAKGINQHGQESRTLKKKIEVARDYFFNTFGLMLESGVRLSDSMNSRAFGYQRRTNFSNFRLKLQDVFLIVILSVLLLGLFFFNTMDAFSFHYYVRLASLFDHPVKIYGYFFTFIVISIPALLEVKEWAKWKYLDWKR